MKQRIVFLIAGIMLLAGQELSSQTLTLYLGGNAPAAAAWRSFFFPGWGQLYNGNTLKGAAIMSLEGIGVASTVILYKKAQKKYDRYRSLGIQQDELYNDYSHLMDAALIAGIFSACLWGYSSIEAYMYARDYPFQLSFGTDRDSVRICLNRKF